MSSLPAGLPSAVTAVLGRFREALRERYGGRLREITLFGSQARGTTHEDSDVDVLVVIDDLTDAERGDVFDLAYRIDASNEPWVGLMPLAYPTSQAQELRSREKLLFSDIARDGIALL